MWKTRCLEKKLSVEIYKYFSNLKDYGFRDQITRSGLSIASNLAEGMDKKNQVKRKLDLLKFQKVLLLN